MSQQLVDYSDYSTLIGSAGSCRVPSSGHTMQHQHSVLCLKGVSSVLSLLFKFSFISWYGCQHIDNVCYKSVCKNWMQYFGKTSWIAACPGPCVGPTVLSFRSFKFSVWVVVYFHLSSCVSLVFRAWFQLLFIIYLHISLFDPCVSLHLFVLCFQGFYWLLASSLFLLPVCCLP